MRLYVLIEKTMHLAFKICGVINSVTQPFPDFHMRHRTVKVFSVIYLAWGLEHGLKVKSTHYSGRGLKFSSQTT